MFVFRFGGLYQLEESYNIQGTLMNLSCAVIEVGSRVLFSILLLGVSSPLLAEATSTMIVAVRLASVSRFLSTSFPTRFSLFLVIQYITSVPYEFWKRRVRRLVV